MQILKGHVSPDTAYLVDDYPYGFRLRCKVRYWLEANKHGVRCMSQTTDPRTGNVRWNRPKGSIYALSMALYLNDEGHVTYSPLSQYCSGAEAQAWLDQWIEGVPEHHQAYTRKIVAAKVAYDAARSKIGPIEPLHVGMTEARKAYDETK